MNLHLQNILEIIQQGTDLDADEKNRILKLLQDADKELAITTFKLDRTEKVKKTTAILLEETIQELEQKRKAVEAQNRNLEIESSLERVRTIAMSMKTPNDMGEVCRVISDQLQLLKVKDIRNVQIAIINESKASYLNYQYFTPYDKIEIEKIDYLLHPTVHEFVQVILQSENAFYTKTFEGASLEEWRNYRKQTNQFPDPKLDESDSVHYYFYSIGQGALGVSTYSPLSSQDTDVFERFRNVFDLAYRRFIDIQTAEAQAKESQIQLALERVRARTMAMQKSNELGEVVLVVFEQLLELGFRSDGCAIVLYNKENLSTEYWMTIPGNTLPQSFTVPYFDHPYYKDELDAWQKGVSYQAFVYEGELKKSFEEFIVNNSPLLNLPDDLLKSLTASEKSVASIAFMEVGSLSVIGPDELSEAHAAILQRFTNTFDQTYTRFLDLQKAEEQAREAQIEAALERIRNRTLLMKESNELAESASILFQEFRALDLLPPEARTYFNVIDEANQTAEVWMTHADGGVRPGSFVMPMTTSQALRNLSEAWKRNEAIHIRDLTGERLTEYIEVLKGIPSLRADKSYQQLFQSPPQRRVISEAIYLQGTIGIISDMPVSNDALDTLVRFAKVFEFTYTRFLDLKKAEAQAKEAQIEAALERVRARTMAMHNSEDVTSTTETLFEELKKLGIDSLRCGIANIHHNKTFDVFGVTHLTGNNTMSGFGLFGMDEHPIWQRWFKSWNNKEEVFTAYIAGHEKEEYFNNINSHLNYLPQKIIQFPDSFFQAYYFEQGAVWVYSLFQHSEPEKEIMKRFASGFSLTFRRYQDLKKAEAQAKEAQIEVALEKIRSRSLAMHHSHEIKDVVAILFEKLKELNLVFDGGAAIHLFTKGSRNAVVWVASPDLAEPSCINLPYEEDAVKNNPIILDVWKAKETGEHIFNKIYSLEEKNIYFDYVFKHNDFTTISNHSREFILQADSYTASFIAEKNSLLGANSWTGQVFSDNDFEVLKRVARVFEQAYVRFLDLQKAEAQAREAQIELGLERVRARAMAMQNSEELNALIGTVFTELTRLDLTLTRCVIMIYEPDTNAARWWMANSEVPETPMNFLVKYHTHPPYLAYFKAWQKRKLKWHYVLEGTIKKDWDDFLFSETELSLLPDFVIAGMRAPDRVYLNASFNNFGNLTLASLETLSDEHFDILLRFAKVFDLTYTRFNDLQKAEAQARESQIQLALERVRARTMAMQRSDELANVATTLFQQVKALGVSQWVCGFGIWEIGDKEFTWYPGSPNGDILTPCKIPLTEHPVFIQFDESRKRGDELLVYEKEGEIQADHYRYMQSVPGLGELLQNMLDSGLQFPTFQIDHIANFSNGNLVFITYEHVPEMHDIFKRFAKVFEQTYTRFLDLQKAEAQAREAQIEVSLERVRAKAMAMQKSEDLANAVAIVFEELDKLNLGMLRCGIGILNKAKRSADVWTTTISDNDTVVQVSGDESMDIHPLLQGAFEAWLNQADHSYVLKGEDLNDYYKALTGVNFKLPDSQSLVTGAEGVKQYYFNAVFSAGGLFAFRETEFPEEAKVILKRFADVFHLTYTRFNDLKQAEAQAREARIEAGLERVRARTMAMHSSEDVSIATATMFDELEKLSIQSFRIGILNIKPDETMEVWSINPLKDGSLIKAVGSFDMTMHPFWQQLYKGWKNKDELLYFDMSGKDREDYIRILNARRDYLPGGIQLPDCHVQAYFFGEGAIWTFSLQPHSEEQKQVVKRFASVFSLTFRRYQDLKQAEAQAKEAKIEAALERVRGKAMAMHNSQDLAATIGVFYRELEIFSITPRRCGVGLLNKETKMAELSTMNTTAVGDSLEIIGTLKMEGHPVLEAVYDNWLVQKEYHPVLRGNEIKEYYQLLRPQIAFPDYPNDEVQFGYFFFFDEGGVYAWTEKEMNEDELQIYRRFTTVLSLTYKRYIDLKQAEASAKEAVKQSALDHIRAEIASMRTTNDLEKITPLIWNELTVLGVPFIRCGVFIMDESQQLIHTFLSTPDGKAFAAFHLPYATPGNISEVLDHWHHKMIYIAHWDDSAFAEFAGTLVKQGALTSPEQYLKTIPQGGFFLHFFPFLQGMLYVGNTSRLNDDEIKLIQSIADTFSTAYARYEDFRKLESAKEQVEKTLIDLKQAQALLVQSEKMASLGELTAGIAHEIQNPLNFVNNFSEVNQELLQEMEDEIEKGNFKEVKAVAKSIIENQAKINHHGKRAEGIVKSMLQHSRSSSRIKEPTGINSLVDEYLRLAYHGLRAKDKSFNATLKHDYDQSIGSINIIPQDMGRVVLNLITNAFHAVTEKRKQGGKGYEPTILVSTKKTNGKIEINIEDNGNGIPAKVLDKIFQPFFTTKPTGSGTGLGLSLAYDIVKAHGGELNVQTREGEGSSFSILLPAI